MINILEDGYYVGIWFLSGPGQDWMAVVDRDPSTGRFRMTSRFRYYADPDEKAGFNPFAPDQKNGLSADFKDKTEDEAIAIVDGLVEELVKGGWCGTRLPWKVRQHRNKDLVRGDGNKFKHVLMGLPYAHFTSDPKAYTDKKCAICGGAENDYCRKTPKCIDCDEDHGGNVDGRCRDCNLTYIFNCDSTEI
jgi:hypothetical protein